MLKKVVKRSDPNVLTTSALTISSFVFSSLIIAETFQHLQGILKSYLHTAEYCHTAVFDKPRGDARVTPEDKQRLAEQRTAEITKRRADFNATNN